jgi:hypothetical protein
MCSISVLQPRSGADTTPTGSLDARTTTAESDAGEGSYASTAALNRCRCEPSGERRRASDAFATSAAQLCAHVYTPAARVEEREAACVKADDPRSVNKPVDGPWHISAEQRVAGSELVSEREQADFLPRSLQLPRDLVRECAARALADDQMRPARLNGADRAHVMRGDLLEPAISRAPLASAGAHGPSTSCSSERWPAKRSYGDTAPASACTQNSGGLPLVPALIVTAPELRTGRS